MSLCGLEKKPGFWTGGEKILQISSNMPLFLLLFEHGCCNYVWLTPCAPSLSPTHCGLQISTEFEG